MENDWYSVSVCITEDLLIQIKNTCIASVKYMQPKNELNFQKRLKLIPDVKLTLGLHMQDENLHSDLQTIYKSWFDSIQEKAKILQAPIDYWETL